MADTLAPVTLSDYINRRLDAEFSRVAMRVLAQIRRLSLSPGSTLQRSLSRLDQLVQRIDKLVEKLEADDPLLLDALDNYEQVLRSDQLLIDSSASDVQQTAYLIAILAVTSKVFLAETGQLLSQGIDPIAPASLQEFRQILQASGIGWDIPDLTFFSDQAVVDMVDSAAWIARMEGWGKGYAQMTRQTILDGIMNGWNPREIARVLRQHAESIPYHAAENLMRTLQLTAYREASLAMEKINGRFITKKIRIATLDNRTCLACIALHGTELEPGQRVDDHYRGRCSEYYVVPGGEDYPQYMQADSGPGGRKLVPSQKGVDWFNSLPSSRQQMQNSFRKSPGKWNAFQAGTPLEKFVTNKQDDVFGNMIFENSLKGMFGEQAEKFYARNQQ